MCRIHFKLLVGIEKNKTSSLSVLIGSLIIDKKMDLQKWLRAPPLQPLPAAGSDNPATTTSTATVSESQPGPSANASFRQPPTDITDQWTSAAIEQRSTSPPSQRTAVDDLGTDERFSQLCISCVSCKFLENILLKTHRFHSTKAK